MKKLLAVVLAACTAFALASCNNNAGNTGDNQGNSDGSYTSGNTDRFLNQMQTEWDKVQARTFE